MHTRAGCAVSPVSGRLRVLPCCQVCGPLPQGSHLGSNDDLNCNTMLCFRCGKLQVLHVVVNVLHNLSDQGIALPLVQSSVRIPSLVVPGDPAVERQLAMSDAAAPSVVNAG